jgi:predicted RNase H-like HicB family nuclease
VYDPLSISRCLPSSFPVRRFVFADWTGFHDPETASECLPCQPGDEGGFTALVPALPGCISEGGTREEALRNVQEAIELYLEPVVDDLDFRPDAEILEIAV